MLQLNFFQLGGKNQPKCPATSNKILMAVFNLVSFNIQGVEDSVVCQHMAAVHFYTGKFFKFVEKQIYYSSIYI
jgi:hypothetical protein